jgi:NADPH:quinone reductase-like Zn-dependent oxidoreductase
MTTLYRAMMVTKAGGPEALVRVELPVEEPRAGQLRVRVRAAGVGSTDLMLLRGEYRYAPKLPVVPGYEIAGTVDAIGPGVTGFALGQRVAALTVYGGKLPPPTILDIAGRDLREALRSVRRATLGTLGVSATLEPKGAATSTEGNRWKRAQS